VARVGDVCIGTSGWNYRHWRGVFYPKELPVKRCFEFYCRQFDTVEVNNTFYRLPDREVFVDWRKQAPPGFLYAIKASRFLTHLKKLKDPAEPLANILGRARALGPHLGPVLYQLPPHWHCDLDRLRDFISALPQDLSHFFEFRDPSWCNEAVRDLLMETGMGYCIHDMRGFECPAWATGPVVYVRFHGPTALRYAGCYTHAHMERWAERINDYRRAGYTVYAYFNNDNAGYAIRNALELRRLLQHEVCDSSPTPRPAPPSVPRAPAGPRPARPPSARRT
jgi:uncharacterized protein YecE (DUF72 family)